MSHNGVRRATPKQLAFLRRLIAEQDGKFTSDGRLISEGLIWTGITWYEACDLIDVILKSNKPKNEDAGIDDYYERRR